MATTTFAIDTAALLQGEATISLRRSLARSQIYCLLARAFFYPDGVLSSQLAEGTFLAQLKGALLLLPRSGALELYREMSELEEAIGEMVAGAFPKALNSEYSRLFTSGGASQSSPYETEYTALHIFHKTQELADISGFYRAFGLEIAEAATERADHVSIELEFMGFLALKEGYAKSQGKDKKAHICRQAQRKFLDDHLGRWVPLFWKTLGHRTELGFYGALGAFAEAFLSWDMRRIGASPKQVQRLPPEPELPLDEGCPVAGGDAPEISLFRPDR